MTTLAKLRKELARLTAASEKASDARARLGPGSSRARVTTANARWARLAEARDRVAAQIREMEEGR